MRSLVKAIPRGLTKGVTEEQAGGGGGEAGISEFDRVGAIYYAVAEAGYVYSGEQDAAYDGRKYNTMAAAVAAIPATPSTPIVINAIGEWTTAETTNFNNGLITGATPTNYVLLRTIGSARHAGGLNQSTAHRLTASTGQNPIVINNSHFHLDGLQVIRTAFQASGYGCIGVSGAATGVEISKCILVGYGLTATEIGLAAQSSGTIKVWNCLIYNFHHSNSFIGAIYKSGAGTTEIYSSVIIGVDKAVYRGSGTLIFKNCYAGASLGSASYYGTSTKTTSASEDTTGSIGLQSILYSTDTFTNVTLGSEDLTLAEGSPLIEAGTDTTGDAAPLNFTDNIAGETRASWNVGAF